MLRERLAFISLQEIPERDPHALGDGLDGDEDVAKPSDHARTRFALRMHWVLQSSL
jgi:hypothetical protein